jgi:hypothetical protein
MTETPSGSGKYLLDLQSVTDTGKELTFKITQDGSWKEPTYPQYDNYIITLDKDSTGFIKIGFDSKSKVVSIDVEKGTYVMSNTIINVPRFMLMGNLPPMRYLYSFIL